MRNMNRFVVVLALVSLLVVGVISAVTAQDTAAPASVQCDSDLILNLYIAERFFGFSNVRDQLIAGGVDTSTWVNLNTINKGQFAPWFDHAMMGSMGTIDTTDMTGMTPLGLNDQQVGSLSSTLMLDDASRQLMMDDAVVAAGVDTTTLSQLPPPSVAGEAGECSQLRTELNRFFSTVAFQDYSGAFAGMSGTGDMSGSTDTTGAVIGEAISWSTTLTGAAEVPAPGDPDGTGSAAITVDSANGQVCYTLSVQNVTLPAQAAHIHRGAAGEPGDVVVPFDLAPDANGSATGCVAVEAALLTEIAQNPTGFYVNIHTSDFPDGALRGQVLGS